MTEQATQAAINRIHSVILPELNRIGETLSEPHFNAIQAKLLMARDSVNDLLEALQIRLINRSY